MKNVFHLLCPEVRDLAIQRFEEPTPIQKEVIPEILNDRNILIISETGSGKTESCLLPLFNKMILGSFIPISILYITPLRSLNRDLLKRILWWSKKLSFDVSVRHGDTSQYERGMQAQNPPDLLISTPETLQAILVGKLMREHLKNIKYIVIDEIHELVASKRGVQLSIALERLKNLIRDSGNPEPKIIALSATIGNAEAIANFLCKKMKIVNTEKRKDMLLSVEYLPLTVKNRERLEYIVRKINEKQSVLVFTNTRETAEVLSFRLKNMKDIKIETHHSSLSKEVRMKAEEEFKNRLLKALLCTSSLELGIDIGSVDFIIQYSSPRQVSKLIQRIGRSGHSIKRISEGVVLATDVDDCFESAIIVDMALSHQIESSEIYGKSFDVLGHQIIGIALETFRPNLSYIYETIKRSHPFKTLSKREFFEVCKFMEKLGYIWINYPINVENKKLDFDKLYIKRRKKAFEYYFSNLSTIPDVRTYKIFDTFSRQIVGMLDAEFIALHGSIGTSFIVNGQGWKILDITNDKVFVEPLQSTEAAIPAWEGELIPVPFEVAINVGELRRKLTEIENPEEYLKNYQISKRVSETILKAIKKQKKFFVPTDKDILIEYGKYEGDNFLVIHSCFGSKVNETIGRTVSSLLTGRFGSIGLKTDPYRIVFKMKTLSDWKDFVQIFKGLTPNIIQSVLELSLPNTELFQWKFTHVAKRFGIISKDADFSKAYIKKVIKIYKNTPVFKETLNEIFREKLDIETTNKVIDLIRNGKIKITIRKGLSPLAINGIETRYELLGSEKPETEIFEIFKKRLLETKIALICTNCANIVYIGMVKGVKTQPVCKNCKSKLIGIMPFRRMYKIVELLKRNVEAGMLTEVEKKMLDRFLSTSYLIAASGEKAVKVMAGRGIGPQTAGRILSKRLKGDELFSEILKAERQFTKTRRFWNSHF